MVDHLGKEMYGLWVLIGSLITYFNLSNFGFGMTLLKELSQHENKHHINAYIGTTLIFFSAISVLLVPISWILSAHLQSWFGVSQHIFSESFRVFWIMYFVFIINLISNIFGNLLFAKGYLKVKNSIESVQVLILLGLVLLFLHEGGGIVGVAFAYFVATSIGGLLKYMYAKHYVNFRLTYQNFDRKVFKKMLQPSWYYFLISISVLVVFSTDNIVISSFLSLQLVAIYAIGFKVISLSQAILFKLVDILIPDIAKLYHDRKYDEIAKLHIRLQQITIFLAFVGYGFLYFFGINIVELWVGKAHTLPQDVFRMMVLFGFVHSWVHTSGIFISAIGIHKRNAYYALGEASLNIVFSIYFVKIYGLFGVALGTILASILTTAWLTPRLFLKHIGSKL